MYLKSLEIQGFKSFPDKISLTFDKGLTAVVGPNGSGKSNIGDAVRWVLGEQSTKTLRGNKMEDIIFSGTVARKPMGFAAVTLNINNSDDVLENLGKEVSVTRKLYRSGESEYLINGKSCRLKDINELFMDTGLGRDGYSIIGQGRIAEIVSAKSSERRDIFEEAAGISKFRYKKSEAERKLSAAEDNLVRLNDILSELESRVEPLRIQAEKAEKFLKLAQERKILEVSVWVSRLEEYRLKAEELDAQILSTKSEYQNLENDISEEEQKYQESYRKMQECTIKSDEIRHKMLEEEHSAAEKKSNIAVFENDIKHSEEAVLTAKRNIENSDGARKDFLRKIQEIDDKILSVNRQREELAEKLSAMNKTLSEAGAKSDSLGKDAENASAEINSLRIRQNELVFRRRNAESIISSEKERLEDLNSRTDKADSEIAAYNEKIAEYVSAIRDNEKKSAETTNRAAGLEKLFSSRKESFESAKAEVEGILYKLKECQQKRKILSDLENNMDGFTGSVKQILKASKHGRISGILGTVAQNISVEPQYALAVETALGGAVQNIIVENEDTAKRCIRFLKEQRGGRATFLPVTSVKGREFEYTGLEDYSGYIATADSIVSYDEKFRGIISSLLGRTAVCEDIDTAAVIAKKFGYKFRIVTLDGQIINAGGSFTGGSAQKSGGVITRKHEIETLDSEIAKLTENREQLSKKAEKYRAESGKLRYDLEAAKSEINDICNEKVRLEAEKKSLEAMCGQLRAQAENAENFAEISRNRITESEGIIAETEKLLSEMLEKIAASEEKFSDVQAEREKLRLERAEFSEKLSQLKMSDISLEKDIQAQETEKEHCRTSLSALDEGSQRFEEEISRQKNAIEQKKRDIETLKKELLNMSGNTEIYNNRILEYRKVHDEQSRIARETRESIKQLNEAKEKFSAQVTRLEERSQSVHTDSDRLISQLLEVYELTRSEAFGLAKKIDDMQAAVSELADIKKKISNLGSVNVDAVEEYREVSERYRFLTEQTEDIKRSKAELEKIISDLTDEMKRIFSENFDIINSNFKSVFTELFGGGNAELILTEPEDVLSSGIEISVAPPGKVIKNLISLSGGEQSFVAIAIYFAILKLRPAPFCVLDEIDAALDELNVRKYAQYLKRFTDKTQFVLVTHRRSAMEEANILYGVTMQEDGISKLLKMEQVDFQEDTNIQ